jgi:hypothetical protein
VTPWRLLAELIQDGAAHKILVGEAAADHAEDVEGTQLGEEEVHPHGFELGQVGLDMPAGRIAIACLELSERSEEAIEVPGRLVAQDVQVQGQDGSPFELRGDSTDDEKLDAVAEQDAEEAEELNALRRGQGGAPRARPPSLAGARAVGGGSS